MNFKDNSVRKVINRVSARRLSLGKCLERPLMQWDSLKFYFLSNFDLHDDPTGNDTDEKTNREKRLVNAFKQPVNQLCYMFVQSIIPILNSFKTFLQAKEPLIHILYHSTLRLYRSLLSRFILLEVVSESYDVLIIDLEDPDVLKDFNSVFKGQ